MSALRISSVGELPAAREGDPDAGGHEVLAAREHERLGEHRGDPLGHLDRGVLVGDVLEQDPELVAAEAGDGVAGADRLREPRSRRGQQLVADLVAEAVVDELEAVEVEEQDRRQRAVARQPGQGVLEPVEEQRPVRQAGERVVQRAMADPVLGRLSFERVGQHVGQGLEKIEVAGVVLAHAARLDPEHPERAGRSLDRSRSHRCSRGRRAPALASRTGSPRPSR